MAIATAPVKQAASKEWLHLRNLQNEQMMRCYAAGLCGLLAIVSLFHWARWLCRRWSTPSSPFVRGSRFVRNFLARQAPGFKSAGHALIMAVYVALNFVIMFLNITPSYANYASRLGWLTVVNMALLAFLAMKNTPLAFLSIRSYEQLNCLHQIAGYVVFVQLVVHAALYTSYFEDAHRLWQIYQERDQHFAILAGCSMLGMVVSAAVIRRIWYELFVALHVNFWIVSLVAAGLHQPDLTKRVFIVTLIAASIWCADRAVRSARVLYYACNNHVTVHPLPGGATKILMKKVPTRAEPGNHVYLWMPSVRKFETHPFTIVSTKRQLEITVRACDGFTRDLHTYAVAHPGASLRASIDGPYGILPDLMSFDKIVLIAGGGGASFTFGLAENMLEQMTESTKMNIVFIWTVKQRDTLTWFKEKLKALMAHSHSAKIKVLLFVTSRPSPPSGSLTRSSVSADSSSLSHSAEREYEKVMASTRKFAASLTPHGSGSAFQEVSEKAVVQEEETATSGSFNPTQLERLPVATGRPDIETLIREAVYRTPKNQRVLIAACGPEGLMRVVRNQSASLIRGDGPAVELHCEQFGW